MDSDTKSLVISIVGSIIGAAIIYYIVIKPAVQLQQSNQSQLQQYQLQQMRQQEYQQQMRQQEYQQQMRQQEYQQPILEQSQLGNSYKNNEKWAISRNKDGFISNIEVIRDAKVN